MALVASSRLDNEQTSVQSASYDTYGASLRRSCTPAYAAAFRVYSLLDGTSEHARPKRLSECRSNAWFSRHVETGEVRIAANACSLRWCPVCSNFRRNFISHSVSEWLHSADHPKFITLTLKHSRAPVDHQISSLYNFFKELRRRKQFRVTVSGGIWFFQVKRSKTDGMWHPHIHCLVAGRFLAKRHLQKMWLSITKNSFVADIRSVRDPDQASQEVSRYATAPATLFGLPLDDALELVRAMHGRRICGTWGTGRGIKLRPPPCEDPKSWKNLGGWSTVMSLSSTDESAKAILKAYHTRTPLQEGITCAHVDEWINNMTDQAWADYNFEDVYAQERSPPCQNPDANT